MFQHFGTLRLTLSLVSTALRALSALYARLRQASLSARQQGRAPAKAEMLTSDSHRLERAELLKCLQKGH
jgi:hypothetical protein